MFLSPTYRTALWFFRRTHIDGTKHLGKLKAEPVQIPSNLIEAEFMVFSSRGQFPKTEATKSVLLFFSISCLNVQQSGVMDGKLELGVILIWSLNR